jgi:hypothetical protein
MKRIVLPLLLLSSIVSFGQGGLLKKASGLLNQAKGGSLSNEEIISGLKEALSIGAQNSANKLSSVDGFFANAAIKVLMPPEAKKVESTLRGVGMGDLVDKAILSMNRAAEEASKSAAPIFVDAVKSMSVNDALGILKGADTAATGYLRSKTLPALTSAFRPVIEGALAKTDATRYWTSLMEAYNKLPTTFKKINPDLSAYVTERSLNGLFFQVAQEEQKIRKDPAARVTETLKKVFGS